jgi:hypothetical protein
MRSVDVKHNLRRVLHLTQARDFSVRAVRAWRRLLPDWTPTLDVFRELDTRPHEHVAAVQIVAEGWEPNDPRWDVLAALLAWERREAEAEIRREYWSSKGAVDRWLEGLDRLEAAIKEEDDTDLTEADVDQMMADAEPAVVIPITVVNSHGQVLTEGETTVETPLKAAFLNNVRPIRHLREKNDAGMPAPDTRHDA